MFNTFHVRKSVYNTSVKWWTVITWTFFLNNKYRNQHLPFGGFAGFWVFCVVQLDRGLCSPKYCARTRFSSLRPTAPLLFLHSSWTEASAHLNPVSGCIFQASVQPSKKELPLSEDLRSIICDRRSLWSGSSWQWFCFDCMFTRY